MFLYCFLKCVYCTMYAIVLHAGRISMNLWTFEPSVYLDLWEDHVKHDQAKQLARRQQLERELLLRWFLFKQQRTLAYNYNV